MLILIGMPIVQIILFGFAISTEVRNVQTAILTSSVNSDTRHIIDRLDASEYFTVKYVVHTNEELNQLFRKGKIELGDCLPPGTAKAAIRFGKHTNYSRCHRSQSGNHPR